LSAPAVLFELRLWSARSTNKVPSAVGGKLYLHLPNTGPATQRKAVFCLSRARVLWDRERARAAMDISTLRGVGRWADLSNLAGLCGRRLQGSEAWRRCGRRCPDVHVWVGFFALKCESGSDDVRHAGAIAGRVDVVSCMVDRICTDRTITRLFCSGVWAFPLPAVPPLLGQVIAPPPLAPLPPFKGDHIQASGGLPARDVAPW